MKWLSKVNLSIAAFVTMFMLAAFSSEAQLQRVTAHLSVTNNPSINVAGSGVCLVTINGSSFLFTNSVGTPASQVLIGTYASNSAAYLYTNLYTYTPTAAGGPLLVTYDGVTNITITGPIGNGNPFTISYTPAGTATGFLTNSFTTNTVIGQTNVVVPFTAYVSPVSQTNVPTQLALGMGAYSQAPLAMGTTLMRGWVDTNSTQVINGAKFLKGANTYSNASQLFYGGTISNVGLGNATYLDMPNFVNGWTNGSSGTGLDSSGNLWAQFPSFSGGLSFTNVGLGTMFFNYYSLSGNADNFVYSFGGVSTYTEQYSPSSVVLYATGGTLYRGYVNGLMTIPWLIVTQSSGFGTNWQFNNTTFGGTNNWQGDLAFSASSISTLVNSNNSDVNVGTNTVAYLSGPSGDFCIVGITNSGQRDGRMLKLVNGNGHSMCFANLSGLDSYAVNRVITGTQAQVNITNNPGVAWLFYNASSNAYVLEWHSN
jgi:hypothetical protein